MVPTRLMENPGTKLPLVEKSLMWLKWCSSIPTTLNLGLTQAQDVDWSQPNPPE